MQVLNTSVPTASTSAPMIAALAADAIVTTIAADKRTAANLRNFI